MKFKRLNRRRVLAKPSGYKSEGFGYGGYGGTRKYVPVNPGSTIITGKPITIPFRRERLSKPNPNEPKGMYFVWVDEDIAEGVIKLRNPLVLPWGAREGKKNWANQLNKKYGVKGRQLTSLLLRENKYDGIITLGGPALNIKQLDLFYTGEQFQNKLKGRPYQIVAFKEGRANILKSPDPEEILRRYFSKSPATSVEREGDDFYSSVLGKIADKDMIAEAIMSRQEDIESSEEKIESLKEDRISENEKLSNLEKAFLILPDIEDIQDNIELYEDADYSDEGDLQEYYEEKRVDTLAELNVELEEKIGEVDSLIELTDAYFVFDDESDPEQRLQDEIQMQESYITDLDIQIESQQSEIDSLTLKKESLESEQSELKNAESGEAKSDLLLELSGVSGLPTNEAYDVSIEYDSNADEYEIEVKGPYIENFERTIDLDLKTIKNEHLALTEDAPPGLGTRILYSQALAAKSEGIKTIRCSAARSDEYVGYYTWARLGYSADIDVALRAFVKQRKADLSRGVPQGLLGKPGQGFDHGEISEYKAFELMLERGFFPEYITLDTPLDNIEMSDLMMTDEGSAWWKEYGDDWDAEFDLQDQPNGEPSRSMQVISSYVKLKQKARGKEIDKWASERAGTAEINLTPEDFEILDIVWDKLREKETKKWRRGLL